MAIINSLVVGRASGSAGKATFLVREGKTIMKEKIAKRPNNPTMAQDFHQNKVYNTALAYHLAYGWLCVKYGGTPGQITGTKNNFGTDLNDFQFFFKTFLRHEATIRLGNSFYAFNHLRFRSYYPVSPQPRGEYSKGLVFQITELINVAAGVHTGGTLVKFDLRENIVSEAAFINFQCIDSVTNQIWRKIREITYPELLAGELYIDKFDNSNIQPAAFMTSDEGAKFSNILIW
jgi:hypothetical protein